MKTLAQLHAYIQADSALTAIFRRVGEKMAKEAITDPGHDLAHFLRVALWTVRIGGLSIDPREGIAAALLHDIVNVPKDSPLRKEASRLCAEEASRILPEQGFSTDAVIRIRDAIRCHSFSRGEAPQTDLARALQDADRLEAVGSIGILRTISTGVRMGAGYFHGGDPWARDRELDDARFTVDHFFVKLLRLTSTMQTPAGQEEAERRTEIMRQFLYYLGEELGEPLDPAWLT